MKDKALCSESPATTAICPLFLVSKHTRVHTSLYSCLQTTISWFICFSLRLFCRKSEKSFEIFFALQAALKLSSDQKRDFIKARQNLIARNEEIKKKRRRIVGNLEVGIVISC